MKTIFKIKNLIYSIVLLPLLFSGISVQNKLIEKNINNEPLLNISFKEDVGATPPDEIVPEYYEDYYIEQIAVGGGDYGGADPNQDFGGAVITDGITDSLYMWGYNEQGQLGLGYNGNEKSTKTSGDEQYVLGPQKVDFGSIEKEGFQIEQISFGFAHSMAVVNDGTGDQIYTWGADAEQQLGNGSGKIPNNKPAQINDDNFRIENGVKDISARMYQNYIIIPTDEGDELYTWGDNVNGQLGINNCSPENVSIATKVIFENKDGPLENYQIEQISAGYDHTAAIINDEDGFDHLYTWGNNSKGQLGYDLASGDTGIAPKEVTSLPDGDIEQISMGGYYSAAVIDDELWTWGDNSKQQLGYETEIKNPNPTPKAVSEINKIEGNIKQISMGKDFSTVVINDNGSDQLYTWGNNEYGQLGLRSPSATKGKPEAVSFENKENIKIYNVAVEASTSMAIVSDGTRDYLYTWGDNQFGQLGFDFIKNIDNPDENGYNYPQTKYSFDLIYPPDGPFTSQWYFYLIISLILIFVIGLIVSLVVLFIKKRNAVA